MDRLAAFAALIFAGALHAQPPPEPPEPYDSAILTCEPPTEYTDNTPIQAPITYRFYHRLDSETTYSDPRDADTCAYDYVGLAPGLHWFVATAIVNGKESAYSPPTSKLVTEVPPNPPGALTVVRDFVAYGLVMSRNRVAPFPVGTIAAGTVCDATQPILGKYVVPREAVTFLANVQPQVVLGTCE